MQAQLIALDWGTSSLRAYKLGPAGVVLEQRSLASGIMHLPTEPRDIAGVLAVMVLNWPSMRPAVTGSTPNPACR